MPHNDLLGFRIARPPGVAMVTSDTVRKQAATWQEAVTALWRTPLPRIIQVVGGDTFETMGGPGLSVAPSPGDGQDTVTVDVFWYAEDRNPPLLGVGQQWGDASPTVNYEAQWFDCFFISGHVRHNGVRPQPWNTAVPLMNNPLVFAHPTDGAKIFAAAGTAPLDLDAVRFRMRLTQNGGETVAQDVPTGGSGRVTAAGSVDVDGSASLTVYRLTGDTMLTEGGMNSGWNFMAYGWMLQRRVDRWWLVLHSTDPSERVGWFRYVGCYKDSGDQRAMDGVMQLTVPNNEQVYTLSRFAAMLGKRLFSVQVGSEKRMSTVDSLAQVTRYGPANNSGDLSCNSIDASGMNTGGALSMALYQNTAQYIQDVELPTQYGPVKYLGCWRDGEPRIMSRVLGDLNGDDNDKVERALQLGKAYRSYNTLWDTAGYFVVGIEAGNQLFMPSTAEQAEGWKVRGALLACEHLDRLGRPLGSDWAMSVYQVHDVDTFNRIPSVFGTGRCCQQWPAVDDPNHWALKLINSLYVKSSNVRYMVKSCGPLKSQNCRAAPVRAHLDLLKMHPGCIVCEPKNFYVIVIGVCCCFIQF